MNEAEFKAILDQLKAYLAMDKTFIKNPFRATEFEKAIMLAHELFPDAKIEIHDDPLQTGAGIFSIEDYDFDVTEVALFSTMIEKADNFEIYPTNNGNVRFAAVFNNVLVRI